MKQFNHRWTRLLMTACLLSICLSLPAHAGERKKVDQIPLSFSSSIEAGKTGGEVYVTVDDPSRAAHCRIVNTAITNPPDTVWEAGTTPKILISLRAESGFYFPSDKADAFRLTGAGAVFDRAEFLDSQSVLHVTVRLSALSDPDAPVLLSGLSWDKGSFTALWDDDSNARYYQVQLFKDGQPVGAAATTYTNYSRLSDKISGKGSYRFTVRFVDNALNRSEWISSDTWEITASEAAALESSLKNTYGPGTVSSPARAAGEWKSDDTGWWFEHPDGTWTTDGWDYIGGEWYYFDHSGYRKSGWIPWQGTWYYCDEDGVMLKNAETPDGYETDSSGAVKAK
ncbi:MAG: lysozyme [Clostridiales bacterium]|nr:lysozyme [Clostridiales bacterium]